MDYKAVIEEQIGELRKVQDKTDGNYVDFKISLAKAITSLCIEAANLCVNEDRGQ